MCVFEETCACPAGYEGKQCQSPGRILSYLDNKLYFIKFRVLLFFVNFQDNFSVNHIELSMGNLI